MCKQHPNSQGDAIVQIVERLLLGKRKKAPQGRKPIYSDSFIIALAVYQKLAGFLIETTFSALDRLGLSERPHRSTKGFVFHLYVTLLVYQLRHSGAFTFSRSARYTLTRLQISLF